MTVFLLGTLIHVLPLCLTQLSPSAGTSLAFSLFFTSSFISRVSPLILPALIFLLKSFSSQHRPSFLLLPYSSSGTAFTKINISTAFKRSNQHVNYLTSFHYDSATSSLIARRSPSCKRAAEAANDSAEKQKETAPMMAEGWDAPGIIPTVLQVHQDLKTLKSTCLTGGGCFFIKMSRNAAAT